MSNRQEQKKEGSSSQSERRTKERKKTDKNMKQRTIMTKADAGKRQEKNKRQKLLFSLSLDSVIVMKRQRKVWGRKEKHVFLFVLNMCVTQLHYTPTQDISGVEDEDEDEANSNGDNRGKR